MKRDVTLIVNGERYDLKVEPKVTLLQAIRDEIGLTGTKEGCGEGECGACTVLLDGEPVNSCLVLAIDVNGRSITTIEGLSRDGQLDKIQEAFVENGAVACGFCTPGMVMTAKAFLAKNPTPTEQEVRQAISGNLCRCTGYAKIVKAIMAASRS